MKSAFLMASSSKGNRSSYPMHWQLSDILRQLHEAHLGIEKTRLFMRESVYWPHIYRDIKMMVKCCAVCHESQTEHRQQPLLAHDVPSTRWTKVASDLIQIKGDNNIYLLPIITPISILSRRCIQQPAVQSPTSLHSGSACLDHHSK